MRHDDDYFIKAIAALVRNFFFASSLSLHTHRSSTSVCGLEIHIISPHIANSVLFISLRWDSNSTQAGSTLLCMPVNLVHSHELTIATRTELNHLCIIISSARSPSVFAFEWWLCEALQRGEKKLSENEHVSCVMRHQPTVDSSCFIVQNVDSRVSRETNLNLTYWIINEKKLRHM